MIYQTTMDNPTAEIISVPLEIYFKGRAEPVNSLVSFCFDTVHLTEDNLVESFMALALKALLDGHAKWGSNTFYLSDSRDNYLFVPDKEEIQAVKIIAPSEEELMEVLC